MAREPDTTAMCPTCGFPTHVFLLASPEVRCPHCRPAWEAAISERTPPAEAQGDPRSIDDLL
jgi:hypothetical protein